MEPIKCLLVLLLATCGFALPTRDLKEDILELLNVLPLGKMSHEVNKHVSLDKAYQDSIKYLESSEFKELVEPLDSNVCLALQDYFDTEVKINVKTSFSYLFVFLSGKSGIPPVSTRAFVDLEKDFSRLVDPKALLEKLQELTEKSSTFRAFYEKLSSETTHQVVSACRDTEAFQNVLQGLNKHGIEANKYLTYVYYFFGWYEQP